MEDKIGVIKKVMKNLCIIILLLLGLAGVYAQKTVTVTIYRVMQVDNLDVPDIDPDRADFYAQIWIAGKMYQTRVFSTDDGRPYWRFSMPVTSRVVRIRIKLLDDDGSLERKDDYVDINPRDNKKDLNFTFDTQTGRIRGDVTGRRGRMIFSEGKHDSDKGRIWFKVE
ncbi:MAG TPA: hypothetical protein VNK96_02045 [Fimbriimonadales bacterium]|nr:hypothetical protein [Fimbriimonadales bacterium]